MAGGGDIRGVQLAGYCKHAVGVCDDSGTMGTKPGELMMGQLELRAVAISGEFKPQSIAGMKKWYGMMRTKPGERMEELLERWTVERPRLLDKGCYDRICDFGIARSQLRL